MPSLHAHHSALQRSVAARAPRLQDCNLGFASAAAARLLDAASLLQRLDVANDRLLSVRSTLTCARGTLAPRVDAASGAGSMQPSALGFQDLPRALALHVFSFVPADARARAALVCRAWRDTVSDASLWTVLDLSPASGVAQPVSDATLRGAAALARGGLTTLCLNNCDALTQEARLEVVTANAGSLRELSCAFAARRCLTCMHVQDLVLAAPQLVLFNVDLCAPFSRATSMMRREPPFASCILQVRRLVTGRLLEEDEEELDEDEAFALSAAMDAHASLRSLQVDETPIGSPAVMDSLCNAAAACKLRYLDLINCSLWSESVPALARLIRGGVLTSLCISNGSIQLLDEASAVQLAGAVARSRTLKRLTLHKIGLWNDAVAAATLMRALTGHPRLQELWLAGNDAPDQAAAGAALGALVAANSRALKSLDVGNQVLGDAGLGPLFDALPRNSHLRVLRCWHTGMSAAFARDVVLPAVRANTSLRELDASQRWDGHRYRPAPPELLEAEALVAARS